jgi:hypothetical protein
MAHKSVTEFEAMGATHMVTLRNAVKVEFLLNKLGAETSLLNI